MQNPGRFTPMAAESRAVVQRSRLVAEVTDWARHVDPSGASSQVKEHPLMTVSLAIDPID